MRRQIEDFKRIIETSDGAENNDGGESTENEEEDEEGNEDSIDQQDYGKNISVEINDL
jgi:hypothetical protein